MKYQKNGDFCSAIEIAEHNGNMKLGTFFKAPTGQIVYGYQFVDTSYSKIEEANPYKGTVLENDLFFDPRKASINFMGQLKNNSVPVKFSFEEQPEIWAGVRFVDQNSSNIPGYSSEDKYALYLGWKMHPSATLIRKNDSIYVTTNQANSVAKTQSELERLLFPLVYHIRQDVVINRQLYIADCLEAWLS